MTNLAVIILAAGEGARMNSDLPKALHQLKGQPLVQHVINTAEQLKPTKIALVVGYKADLTKNAIGEGFLYAEQKEQLGTGHAVEQAASALLFLPTWSETMGVNSLEHLAEAETALERGNK